MSRSACCELQLEEVAVLVLDHMSNDGLASYEAEHDPL
jgi:hypothetical protein